MGIGMGIGMGQRGYEPAASDMPNEEVSEMRVLCFLYFGVVCSAGKDGRAMWPPGAAGKT